MTSLTLLLGRAGALLIVATVAGVVLASAGVRRHKQHVPVVVAAALEEAAKGKSSNKNPRHKSGVFDSEDG